MLSSEIVNPQNYTYHQMLKDLTLLKKKYHFIEVFSIGKSVLEKPIPCIKLGKGSKKILCNGSHHAREWITTPLLMKFIELFCLGLTKSSYLYGYDLTQIYLTTTILIIPMVNPDGVNLVINGISQDNPYYSLLLEINNNDNDFSHWKSNIRGVDINRNYNAGWKEYKSIEHSLQIFGPCSSGYAGPYPESEPETQAMVSFTRLQSPDMVLAFHAQGEEIYWDYNKIAPKNSYFIAQKFSQVSGYSVVKSTPISTSFAGYKDWFIKEFRRPGFTIEVGKGSVPVPIHQFEEIIEKNFRIILCAMTLLV